MTLSVVEIFNNALGLAGTRTSLSNVNEKSREAELCRQYYPTVREQVFAASHWACGKKAERLGLLRERGASDWTNADPLPPWNFAYARPSDCCRPRYFTDYAPFEVSRYGAVNAISSNAETPVLVYTKVEEDTSLWDIGLTTAVFAGLAAMVTRPLTGSSRKAQVLVEEANRQILIARQDEANNDFTHYESMPDWFSNRGISGPAFPNRFVYPVGPLFVSGSV